MFPTAIQQIDFSKSEQSILSIRITTDGFYFSIYNPLNPSPCSFFKAELDLKISLVANFKNLVANNPFLSQLYKQVNIIIANTKTVLHPSHLLDEKNTDTIYYLGQRSSNPNTTVLHNTLSDLNQTVIFGVNNLLLKYINEHFRTPSIWAQTTCLIKYFNIEAAKNAHKVLFVHFSSGVMQLYAYDKKKLLLNNIYNTAELNNQIYYILYCWKQLKFSQEKDSLHFCGELSNKLDLMQTIKKYIVDVCIDSESDYIDLKSINL